MALHVVNRPQGQGVMLEDPAAQNAIRRGQEMVAAGAAFGERLGIAVDTSVRVSPNPEAEILDFADEGGFDIVVIGAANRPVTDSPFFGHRVSYMIERSRIPVIIVALPSVPR